MAMTRGLLAGLLLVLGACGGGAAPAPTGAATTGVATLRTNVVTLDGFAFDPPAIEITVGTTVMWTNKDGTAHTLTSGTHPGLGLPAGKPDGKFDTIINGAGGTFSFTFAQAGTVTYFCQFHTNMRGTVVAK